MWLRFPLSKKEDVGALRHRVALEIDGERPVQITRDMKSYKAAEELAEWIEQWLTEEDGLEGRRRSQDERLNKVVVATGVLREMLPASISEEKAAALVTLLSQGRTLAAIQLYRNEAGVTVGAAQERIEKLEAELRRQDMTSGPLR